MYVRVAELFTYTKRCENSALYLHMFLLVFSTLVSRNVDRCGQTRIYLVRNSWPRNFCIFTFLSDLFLFTFLYFVFYHFVMYFCSFFVFCTFIVLSYVFFTFVFCIFIILFYVFWFTFRVLYFYHSIWCMFVHLIINFSDLFAYFHWYILINSYFRSPSSRHPSL